MSLNETYLAKWKKIPKNAKPIAVTRTSKSILAPSAELLEDWKGGKITWSEYDVRYRDEILNSPKAFNYLHEIKKLSKTENIYLVCYESKPPCHRFILLDILNKLDDS